MALKFILNPNYPYPDDPGTPVEDYEGECEGRLEDMEKEINFLQKVSDVSGSDPTVNIVRYFGHVKYDGMPGLLLAGPVIKLEFCSHGALEDFMKTRQAQKRELSWREAKDACCQLLDGLV